MRLIPDSGSLREFNACHNPTDGRFCSTKSGFSAAQDDTPAYVSHRKTKRRGPKTPPSPGTTEGVKYQQKRDNAIRSAQQRRIINQIRKRDDTAKDDTPEYGSKPSGPKAFVDELFTLGDRSPFDPRELVLDAGNGGYAIIEPRAYDDHVYLTAFRTTEQGKGHGKAVMDTITKLADKQGVTLRLVASPMAVHAPLKKTPKARLIGFYKRHGFTHDPAYTRSSGHMIRKPVPKDNPAAFITRGGVYDRKTLRQQRSQILKSKRGGY